LFRKGSSNLERGWGGGIVRLTEKSENAQNTL